MEDEDRLISRKLPPVTAPTNLLTQDHQVRIQALRLSLEARMPGERTSALLTRSKHFEHYIKTGNDTFVNP